LTLHAAHDELLDGLQAVLDHRFKDVALLRQAVTHASYANEEAGALDNQRLEFLGDAVLSLVISTHLYRRLPGWTEGKLSQLRSKLVCEPSLAVCAERWGLGPCLRLGRGERAGGGQSKASLLSDAYEAVLAALYLDGGYECAERAILGSFAESLQVAGSEPSKADHKTRLQELVQARGDERPQYVILETSGPPHARTFVAEVRVGAQVLGEGTGGSKKAAQQEAARVALARLAP
jgi:ribonuclease-3